MYALESQRVEDPSVDHDDPIEEVFEDQIACADLVVLAKADLIGEGTLRQVEKRVTDHLTPSVKIVAARNGKVDPAILIGLGLAVEDDIHNRHSHHDHEEEHDHDEFESFDVDVPAVAAPEEIVRRIAEIAKDDKVLRVKGFVEVSGKPMRLQVQAVGSRIDHYFDRLWGTGERRSRLIVIGEAGLNRKRIADTLAG